MGELQTCCRRYLLVASVLLYVVCLFRDAFCDDRACTLGFAALTLGPGGLLVFLLEMPGGGGAAALAWFANPIILVAWIVIAVRSRRSKRISVWLCLAALLFAASFMLMKHIDNGLSHSPITEWRSGYWLWLASLVAALLAALCLPGRPLDRPASSKLVADT